MPYDRLALGIASGKSRYGADCSCDQFALNIWSFLPIYLRLIAAGGRFFCPPVKNGVVMDRPDFKAYTCEFSSDPLQSIFGLVPG